MSKSVIGPCAGCCCSQTFPESESAIFPIGGYYNSDLDCCLPQLVCLYIDGWDLSICRGVPFPVILGAMIGNDGMIAGWTNDPINSGGILYPDCYMMCNGSYTWADDGSHCGPITGGCGQNIWFTVSKPSAFQSGWVLDISTHGYCGGFSGAGAEIQSTTTDGPDCANKKFAGIQFTNFQSVWEADGLGDYSSWTATITPLPCSACEGAGFYCEGSEGHKRCIWRCHSQEGETSYTTLEDCQAACGAGYYCIGEGTCQHYDEAPASYVSGPWPDVATCAENCPTFPGWYCVDGVCAFYDDAPANYSGGPWATQQECEYCCGDKYYCIQVGPAEQNQHGCVTCPNPDTQTILSGPYDTSADCNLHCVNQSWYCVFDPDINGLNCVQFQNIGPLMEIRSGPYSTSQNCSDECKEWYCCTSDGTNRFCNSPATGTVLGGPYFDSDTCLSYCSGYYVSGQSASEPLLFAQPKEYPTPNITPTKPTAVVSLAVGVKGREVLDISQPVMRQYAKRVGADYHRIDVAESPYPLGEKFRFGGFLDVYDRALFLDADLILTPDCPDLFSVVPADQLGLHDDYQYCPTLEEWFVPEYRGLLDSQGWPQSELKTCFNTGVIVASRCHRDVLRGPSMPYPVTHTAEQSYTNLVIQRLGTPVFRLPWELNWQYWADPSFSRTDGVKVWHYANCPHEKRLEYMRAKRRELYPSLRTTTKPVLSKGCGCGGGKINGKSPVQADAERRRIERLKRDAIRAKLNK